VRVPHCAWIGEWNLLSLTDWTRAIWCDEWEAGGTRREAGAGCALVACDLDQALMASVLSRGMKHRDHCSWSE